MALQTTINLNVDFHDNKYIMFNAKQYDTNSRLIVITCYDQGDIYTLNASKHSAYIKYRKPDGYNVFSFCKINYKGEVIAELTQQMLAVGGICYAELVIINKGDAQVNATTGEIITIDNPPIFSTMAFCVNVYETVVDNSLIESSNSFDALNDLMQRAEADYMEVMLTSKSYAKGDTGIREGENTDNAKYYYEQALESANNAKASEMKSATSESNAKTSESNAKTSEINAKTSETNAATSESNADISEANAKVSEINAKTSETNAATSESNAYDYSVVAKRYAVGGTGTVTGEDTDNAEYYYAQTKGISDSVSGTLSPKGTISFEELAMADKFTGYMYVINESFVTDDTFVDGEGVEYPAGTIVFYTVDGLWSCFDGVKIDVATVDEMKSYLGIE